MDTDISDNQDDSDLINSIRRKTKVLKPTFILSYFSILTFLLFPYSFLHDPGN